MQTKQDWEWLAASSEYQTAIAVQELLREEKWMEASEGLAFLVESIISHVIKWKF